jgi:acetoin utilization protein AcuB
MLVRDWMTTTLVTVSPTDTLLLAKSLMAQHNIRRLPVVAARRLVGILTDRDLRDYTPSHCTTLDIFELHYMLDKMTVGEVMSTHLYTLEPSSTMEEAARLMYERKIGGLPVVNDRTLVGIVTESDIFRMVGTQPATPSTTTAVTNATTER